MGKQPDPRFWWGAFVALGIAYVVALLAIIGSHVVTTIVNR